MKKVYITAVVLVASLLTVSAQAKYLTLDACRDMALESNKQSLIEKENLLAAQDLRRAALSNFFPTASANGAYVWNEKNLYLLSDTYDFRMGSINSDGSFTFKDGYRPSELGSPVTLGTLIPGIDQTVADWVADEYEKAREFSEIDIHNVFVAQVGISQPIFLGGKVVNLYKIAKANENIAQIQAGKQHDDILVQVDEAYWRVISVEQKYLLADKYCTMLEQVERNISDAVEEGTLTQADLLRVRVQLNEAQVNRQKAEDGLRLSKMALCQIIGLPLESDIKLDSDGIDKPSLETVASVNMDEVWSKRQELKLLEEAQTIAQSGVKIAASTLMPNVIASANYTATNPNLYNGFHNGKNFRGSFSAGVVVNIPIAHANDIYQLKAAKHKARTIELQLEEAREKIELQATQSAQQLNEANRKLIMATANIENAEENLRMAQASFAEGMITSTELLGAQTAWLKAYSEKIDAAIDVRMYEVYLKKNTGVLTN